MLKEMVQRIVFPDLIMRILRKIVSEDRDIVLADNLHIESSVQRKNRTAYILYIIGRIIAKKIRKPVIGGSNYSFKICFQ